MTNSNPEQPKSWRDVLPIHPAADLFPLLSREELLALGADIKEHGLKFPIVLWSQQDGKTRFLLDGRNRLDAMEAVGIQIVLKDWRGGGAHQLTGPTAYFRELYGRSEYEDLNGQSLQVDPYAFVLSANIARRHLTAEQKRDLIAKLLKAKPEQSNLQIAKQVKADDKTVAKVRTELEARSEIPNVEARTDINGRKQAAHKPAKTRKSVSAGPLTTGSGETTQIKKGSPEWLLGETRFFINNCFPKMDAATLAQAKAMVAAWQPPASKVSP